MAWRALAALIRLSLGLQHMLCMEARVRFGRDLHQALDPTSIGACRLIATGACRLIARVSHIMT